MVLAWTSRLSSHDRPAAHNPSQSGSDASVCLVPPLALASSAW
jgi:hypothetical protein